MFFYLKDTTYLDDAGKKSLYVPKEIKEKDALIAEKESAMQMETIEDKERFSDVRDKPYRWLIILKQKKHSKTSSYNIKISY